MIVPFGDKILVKGVKDEKKSILIVNEPDSWKFLVIAVGDDVKHVDVDDIVLIGKFNGATVDYEGEKYILIEEKSILAKIV